MSAPSTTTSITTTQPHSVCRPVRQLRTIDPAEPTASTPGRGHHLSSTGPTPRAGRTERESARTGWRGSAWDEHRLLMVVDADLNSTGKWTRWRAADPRLADLPSLAQAVEGWRVRRDRGCYQAVAALAALGSRRGGDDDDAALAVVVLLAPGLARLASDLRDVCELDDVRATVWEEVKLAEPQLGNRAPRFLLQRAHQRLTRPGAGMVTRGETTSLDEWLGWTGDATSLGEGEHREPDRSLELAQVEDEDPVFDLADLLAWARGTGVIEPQEADLLVDLVTAARHGLRPEDAQRVVGAHHGVTMRTVRRRRNATLERLRTAAPDYIAAVA